MSELILPFAIMALTVAVAVMILAGVRKWLGQRDEYMKEYAAPPAATAKPGHAAAPRKLAA